MNLLQMRHAAHQMPRLPFRYDLAPFLLLLFPVLCCLSVQLIYKLSKKP
jgi:hypothetical protein